MSAAAEDHRRAVIGRIVGFVRAAAGHAYGDWAAQSPKIQVYADDTVVALGKGVTGYVYSHEADFRTLGKTTN